MKKIKLTKNYLKKEKDDLKRYRRYLPTLYIKKRQLQSEIVKVRNKLLALGNQLEHIVDDLNRWISLLGSQYQWEYLIDIETIETSRDNIAGIEVEVLKDIQFDLAEIDYYHHPLWYEDIVSTMSQLVKLKVEMGYLGRQEKRLSDELRITAQRVNLFEKVRIPESINIIKKIRIFLGDQQTAAIGWARMAKAKIEKAKLMDEF